MDSRSSLLSSGAVKEAVKLENKKLTLKIKKAAPKPTTAGNWKESDASSMSCRSDFTIALLGDII